MGKWTLFSNHGHVLICLSRDPQARLRDVAVDVGITERAVQKIVRDLQDASMITVKKNGRRNSYRIHQKSPLRHDIEAGCTLRDLLKTVNKPVNGKARKKDIKNRQKISAGIATDSEPARSRPLVNDPASDRKPAASKVAVEKKKKTKATPEKGTSDEAVKSIEKQQRSLF